MSRPLAAWLFAAVACGGGPPSDSTGSDAPAADADPAGGEPDAPPPSDDGDVPHKVVFATSSKQTGDVGGPSGADGICADLADAAGLEGTFRAWVSSPEESAAQRIAHAEVPYARTDGVRVADDWDDLVDGELAAAINRDEAGERINGDAWTGTLASGDPADLTCGGFASIDELGVCGSTDATDGQWTDRIQPFCTSALRLYCIQE